MTEQNASPLWHGTTIVTVRKGGKVVIAGDGQVSLGNTVIKHTAARSAGSAAATSSPVSPAPPPTPSRCSSGSRPSSSSIRAN